MVSKHADKLKVAFLGVGELADYILKAFFNQKQVPLGKVILYAHDSRNIAKYTRLKDDLGQMKLPCPVSLEEELQKLTNPNIVDFFIITADAANSVWGSLGKPAPFPLPATYEFTQNFQDRQLITTMEDFKRRNDNNTPISRETLERKISQKVFGSRTPEEVREQYKIFSGLFAQGLKGTRLTEFLPYNIPVMRHYGKQLQGCQVPVLMYTNPIDVACYLFTVFSSMNHKLVLGNNEGDSVRLRKRIVPEAVAEVIGNEKSVKGVEKLLKSLKNDALVIGPHDDYMVPITSSIAFYGKGGMPTDLKDLSDELDTVVLQQRIAALAPQLFIEKKDTLYVWYEATERALKMMMNRKLADRYLKGSDTFRKDVTLYKLPVLSTFIDPTAANVPDTIPHFTGLPVFRSWDGHNASVFVPYRDLSKDAWGESILNEKERLAFKRALVHGSKIILALKDLGVIDRLLEGEKGQAEKPVPEVGTVGNAEDYYATALTHMGNHKGAISSEERTKIPGLGETKKKIIKELENDPFCAAYITTQDYVQRRQFLSANIDREVKQNPQLTIEDAAHLVLEKLVKDGYVQRQGIFYPDEAYKQQDALYNVLNQVLNDAKEPYMELVVTRTDQNGTIGEVTHKTTPILTLFGGIQKDDEGICMRVVHLYLEAMVYTHCTPK